MKKNKKFPKKNDKIKTKTKAAENFVSLGSLRSEKKVLKIKIFFKN